MAAAAERTRHEFAEHGLVVAVHVPEDSKKAWISQSHVKGRHPG